MNIDWLLELDRQVLAFFNGSDSLFLDAFAMTFTSGLTWIPLYLALFYIVIKNNENMTQIFLIVMSCLVCLFFTYGLADFIAKPYVARWRPTNDPILRIFLGTRRQYFLDSPVFRASRQKSPAHDGVDSVVAAELLDADVSRCSLSGRHPRWSRVGCYCGYFGLSALSENLLQTHAETELCFVAIHIDGLQPQRHRRFGDGGGFRVLLHRYQSRHHGHLIYGKRHQNQRF